MNSSCWRPTASVDALASRSEITWKLRKFFQERGFLEVHTPTLSHDTVVDRFINPIEVSGRALDLPELREKRLYLQTSPEFCMKRLLAAGMQAIYQICPAFRASEKGEMHNPEFTMVEWYRVGDDMQLGIELLAGLIEAVVDAPPIQHLTYQAAFEMHAGVDPLDCNVEDLISRADELKLGIDANWSDEKDEWLNLFFADLVQPKLIAPTIVSLYPVTQSALARISPVDPRVSERFELFMHGVELANGYNELVYAPELEKRNELVNAQRVQDGNVALPEESRLLDALRHGFPNSSGCALGLDRLVMVALGCSRVDQVIAFPLARA
ncbi:MAG: elongation factor P--(R)-beta-lysine ligase [Planctomycetales bacterium]|nr:elongation factor P--(R)-beta-lysine ligase [Planctomycetales bacterium]